jgi:hypothetical protein
LNFCFNGGMDDSVLTLLDSSFDLPATLPPVEIARAELGPGAFGLRHVRG